MINYVFDHFLFFCYLPGVLAVSLTLKKVPSRTGYLIDTSNLFMLCLNKSTNISVEITPACSACFKCYGYRLKYIVLWSIPSKYDKNDPHWSWTWPTLPVLPLVDILLFNKLSKAFSDTNQIYLRLLKFRIELRTGGVRTLIQLRVWLLPYDMSSV